MEYSHSRKTKQGIIIKGQRSRKHEIKVKGHEGYIKNIVKAITQEVWKERKGRCSTKWRRTFPPSWRNARMLRMRAPQGVKAAINGIFNILYPGGSDVKVSAYNVGDRGSTPGLGRSPWRRKWQPTPVLLPGKSHGWMQEPGGLWSMVPKSRTRLRDFTCTFKVLSGNQLESITLYEV